MKLPFSPNGIVRRQSNVVWDQHTNKMFPTSDVCRIMGNGKFAASSLFTTTGICAKVDLGGRQ